MKKDEQSGSKTEGGRPVSTPAPEEEEPLPGERVHATDPTASSMGRSVELHIEELILQGFPAVDRHLVGEAFERELTRLLTEQGTPRAITQAGEIARLDGVTFELKTGHDSETMGARLANAIYERLGR